VADGQTACMAGKKIDRNDQAAKRTDGNEPGNWPGSGTTVEGHVESATSGLLADAPAEGKGSASTSAEQQEPVDRRAERGS
jgi:hypothetical protein